MSEDIKHEGDSENTEMVSQKVAKLPFKTFGIVAVAVLGGALVGAMATDTRSPGLNETQLREIASSILNGAEVSHIRCGVELDLCEVLVEDTLLYMDRTGKYGIAGNILDFETRTDVTDQREQELVRFAAFARGEDPAAPTARPTAPTQAAGTAVAPQPQQLQASTVEVTLPVENAVVYNAGQGLPVLNVFSDLNCSFCHRLHQETASMGEYEIREYFIEWLGPSSREKALLVLCADDRVEAAGQMYSAGGASISRSMEECAADYGDIITQNTDFARSFGLQGTPAMYFEDGRQIGRGYAPAAQIHQEINAS